QPTGRGSNEAVDNTHSRPQHSVQTTPGSVELQPTGHSSSEAVDNTHSRPQHSVQTTPGSVEPQPTGHGSSEVVDNAHSVPQHSVQTAHDDSGHTLTDSLKTKMQESNPSSESVSTVSNRTSEKNNQLPPVSGNSEIKTTQPPASGEETNHSSLPPIEK
uniref:hypothetical protein n=1 Tax=Pectobacterium versatile TaxID=2488639 RepID=UPI001F45414F